MVGTPRQVTAVSNIAPTYNQVTEYVPAPPGSARPSGLSTVTRVKQPVE